MIWDRFWPLGYCVLGRGSLLAGSSVTKIMGIANSSYWRQKGQCWQCCVFAPCLRKECARCQKPTYHLEFSKFPDHWEKRFLVHLAGLNKNSSMRMRIHEVKHVITLLDKVFKFVNLVCWRVINSYLYGLWCLERMIEQRVTKTKRVITMSCKSLT